MSIMRIVKREKPYVQIDKTALNDARLSFRAKGFYAYLMSKPNDWRINLKHLENMSPNEGRTAVRKAMQELQNAGYLTRRPARSDRGRLNGWDFALYETPLLAEIATQDEELLDKNENPPSDHFPSVGKPSVGSPSVGQRTTTNKEAFTQNREELKNEKKPPLSPPQNGGGMQHGGDRTRRKRRRGQVSHDGIIEWMREKTQEMAPCTPKTSKSLAP